MAESKREVAGVGGRIRRRRLELGIKQSRLAEQLGISAAYLNLIEHDRRRIGGRLLKEAARELDLPVAQLAQGAAEALLDELRAAAAGPEGSAADPGQAEAMAGAFPGWAQLIAAQARRLVAQDQAIAALSDRLTHDPHLSASMHEVLSLVTSIRSTAAILREEEALDPEWLARFHRNLSEDSQRLTESATALVGYLDTEAPADRSLSTPQEEAEAWFAARGWHLPELEQGGDIDGLLAAGAPASPAGREELVRLLRRYAADARALPLEALSEAVVGERRDPLRLADRFGVDPMAVFRRLAHLPEAVVGRVGIVMCDGSGTLTFRRPVEAFAVPRYGAACPLWPLYAALVRPMRPVRQVIELAGPVPRRFTAYALARPYHPGGFSGPEIVEAAMLLFELDTTGTDAVPVGTSCRICPREGCVARREASLLSAS